MIGQTAGDRRGSVKSRYAEVESEASPVREGKATGAALVSSNGSLKSEDIHGSAGKKVGKGGIAGEKRVQGLDRPGFKSSYVAKFENKSPGNSE